MGKNDELISTARTGPFDSVCKRRDRARRRDLEDQTGAVMGDV